MQRVPSLVTTEAERDSASLGGIVVGFGLDAQQTGGVCSTLELLVEPHQLATPHLHTREDEFLYVIDGSVGVRVGDDEFELPAGATIFKPRGIAHTYWNASDERAKLLMGVVPGGWEGFFRELGQLRIDEGEAAAGKTPALGERYGASFRMDWVADLESRHDVRLRGR